MRFDQLLDKLQEHGDRWIDAYQGRQRFRRTYAELRVDVDEASAALERAGVTRGMRVGLLGDNSYEWVVYDLALIGLGVNVVALSDFDEVVTESLEAARDRYGLNLLLVDERAPAVAPWVGRLVGLGPLECEAARDVPRPEPGGDEFSWVFSSGSTGRLKCMSVNRAGAEHFVRALPRYGGGAHPDDVGLLFLPLSHYQQRLAIYAAIWHGTNIALATPKLLFTALREVKPTLFLAPPLFYEMVHRRVEETPGVKGEAARALVRALERLPAGRARRALQRVCTKPIRDALGGRVRHMLTGMAPIQPETLRLFETLGLPLYEGYAMTEVGMITCNVPGANRLGSVGRPVDRDGVRLAEDGEVLVRRDNALASGYLFHDPDEARATFLDAGWIATGDIGRFDEDGYLYLVGRKKVMILTPGGDKLHPEVLERRLNECAGVRRSVVCSVDAAQLVAIVSVVKDTEATRAAVERCVRELNEARAVQLQIGHVRYTEEEFSLENNLLTRSLKLDRAAIQARFASPEVGS
ncbi:MAG: AMP-binding protein [Myxococcales bacterium]|nr:AMP-binding protein [Myxococcales bacterium]MCB9751959.1 AMP-binding protein [Myxococcales bacterium]